MTPNIVIKPTAVFEHPSRIIAGHIILSPEIFPRDIKTQVFLSSGEIKLITLHSTITTSPEALKSNLYGFTYSGDTLTEGDLADDVLISNIPLQQAFQHYQKYKEGHSKPI